MDPKFVHHVLDVAGPQAAHIAQLWWLTVAICAAVFAAVLIALAIALRRGRAGGDSTAQGGPDSGGHGRDKLAGDGVMPAVPPPDLSSLTTPERRVVRTVSIATFVSALLLVALVVASVLTDRALANLALERALHIQVTAHQWWWDVRYTGEDRDDPSQIFSTANELHVPVGRPVIVELNAADVIHSFWVPNLHGKKDLLPGQTSTIRLQADRPGTYRGLCAEFCGLQHAWMDYAVVAESPADFDAWSARQRQDAPEPTDDATKRGRDLFLSGSCMLCHAIQGTPGGGRQAPDLTHVASRASLGAGRLANTPENLAAWIRDPQQLKPGVNMPAHPLPDADMNALVAYLETLK